MRILVTGASGFVGSALIYELHRRERFSIRGASRSNIKVENADIQRSPPLDAGSDWRELLEDVEVVVHSAARVHVMNDRAFDPLAEFRLVNVEGTVNLARQAAASGVRRFIFISSIKVNGEGTALGRPYKVDDLPAPKDPYGVSKMEAEDRLRAVAADTGIELTIIRPVLVYGPGVKANFRNMMDWLTRGVPLPLGGLCNKRSLVALDNLLDLIITCINHPAAVNETFLVSDNEDLSTPELLRRMGFALGHPARLISVPPPMLQMGARLLGKGALAQRLCGSLQVDIAKTRSLLGWSPVVGVDEALRKTAQAFKQY